MQFFSKTSPYYCVIDTTKLSLSYLTRREVIDMHHKEPILGVKQNEDGTFKLESYNTGVAWSRTARQMVISRVATLEKGVFTVEFPNSALFINKDMKEIKFRTLETLNVIKEVYIASYSVGLDLSFLNELESVNIFVSEAASASVFYELSKLSSIKALFSLGCIPNDIDYLFRQSKDTLETVYIAKGTGTVGYGCFQDCTKLKTVYLCDEITSLGDNCFRNCKALKSIVLPFLLTSMGSSCFEGSGLESVIIPPKMAFLHKNTFSDCKELERVSLPEGMSVIGKSCFRNCTALCNITYSTFYKTVEELNKPVYCFIGTYCFAGCKSLKRVALPKNIAHLGAFCYLGCSSLEQVTIEAGVGYKEGCFENCTSLREVEIKQGVTSLPKFCFRRCSSLEEVFLPNSLKSVGSLCFSLCSNLEYIELNEGLKHIGPYCFAGCTSMDEIMLPSSIKPEDFDIFKGTVGYKDTL